jgi:hypothetical protein
MKHMPVTDVFKEVFGQHVNKNNLITFFSSDAVKFVWLQVYLHSREFKQWKKTFMSFPVFERNKLVNYLGKI